MEPFPELSSGGGAASADSPVPLGIVVRVQRIDVPVLMPPFLVHLPRGASFESVTVMQLKAALALQLAADGAAFRSAASAVRAVSAAEQLLPPPLTLIFRGSSLADSQTLLACRIEVDSTVRFVMRQLNRSHEPFVGVAPCGEIFTERAHMLRHVAAKHSGVRVACNFPTPAGGLPCGKTFTARVKAVHGAGGPVVGAEADCSLAFGTAAGLSAGAVADVAAGEAVGDADGAVAIAAGVLAGNAVVVDLPLLEDHDDHDVVPLLVAGDESGNFEHDFSDMPQLD